MHGDADQFLATLAAVLCVAALTTVLFQRLHQPVVLGYLLAGMIVGPQVPVPIEADPATVRAVSELGIILLMFALGLEFSLRKLLRVGLTAGVIALVQCSLMVWLGYLVGQALGWTRLASLFAGAAIAISSTTIIVKAFAEQKVTGDFTHLVFGVLIVEDLVAIFLLTILTTLSAGGELSAGQLAQVAGRLALFLAALTVGGLLVVPRLMRWIVGLDRPETTVVASVGLAFGFSLLALYFGYSVALGAFLAGSLVGESGVARQVERLVEPVRDVFGAVFFVSVGMMIDPRLLVTHWQAVLLFTAVVLVGKIVSVAFAAFLTGQGVPTAIKTGMSLAQIGEFSFIIAGVGLAAGVTGEVLYPITVAVSAITTLATPWLIRGAPAGAAFVDRKLPRPLQTFAALYGSWLGDLRAATDRGPLTRARQLVRWLAADAAVVAAIAVGISWQLGPLAQWLATTTELAEPVARRWVIGLAVAAALPFLVGMLRVAQSLGLELADRALPRALAGKPDLADAPRRLFVVTLQLAIVLLVGGPLLAITSPFLPPFTAATIFLLLLVGLAVRFWRNATNLQGHTRAAAQALAEALAGQSQSNLQDSIHDTGQYRLSDVDGLLVGLGSPVAVELPARCPLVGKTLSQSRLRALSGATILAIRRGEHTVPMPAGREQLLAGDVVALAGTDEAIAAARELLSAPEPAAAQMPPTD